MNTATLPAHDAFGSDAELATPSVDANRGKDEGRPVREIQALCARHNLPCGSPADLPSFLRALGENKLLAMNFWSAINRMGDGKHGRALDPGEVREAVVCGVTGQSVEEISTSPQQREWIDRLTRLLAGEDVQLTDAAVAPAIPPSSSPEASLPTRLTQDGAAPEPAPIFSRQQAAGPPSGEALPVRSVSPPVAGRARLILDAEPESPAATRTTRLRIQPESTEAAREQAIPLSGYAARDDEGKPARRIATVVVGLILAGCAGLLLFAGVSAWRHPDNTARQGVSSFARQSTSAFQRLDASIHAGLASAHAAWSGTRPSSTLPPTPSDSTPAPGEATPAAQPAKASQTSITPRAAATVNANDSPPAVAPAPPASVQPVAEAGPSSAAVAWHASSQQADDSADFSRDATLTAVPAGVMKDHLISSRFPIVPDADNANGITGYVTVAAVITDRGTVEHAYAINGPEELRQPAIDAVSQWRYRPYLLNGTPINVRTTIVVNFAGD
ncbi:MAG TPA: energy transducer TonB [Acidobacteriaceae bacterium]|nr:energy transducer TonB [Acidobacteriaceae bacterium]